MKERNKILVWKHQLKIYEIYIAFFMLPEKGMDWQKLTQDFNCLQLKLLDFISEKERLDGFGHTNHENNVELSYSSIISHVFIMFLFQDNLKLIPLRIEELEQEESSFSGVAMVTATPDVFQTTSH